MAVQPPATQMIEASKRKSKKGKKRKAAKDRTPAKDHKRDFDQLLDDAIFGVKERKE